MKAKVFLVSMFVVCTTGVSMAQLYTTAPAYRQTMQANNSGAYYDNAQQSASQGVRNPYVNPFASTALTTGTYTVAVSAQNMASVGLAEEPEFPPVFKAPPAEGDVLGEDDKIDDVTADFSPVGEGTGVLLLCALLFALVSAFKAGKKTAE